MSRLTGSRLKQCIGRHTPECTRKVALAVLLLANGLRSATPRRLRELENEHGAFRMRTYSRDGVQHYILESPKPDAPACARYWIKANLRSSPCTGPRRVLGLLSAYL